MTTIIHNAKITTLDLQNPTATAIAIDGGRILMAGDDDTLLGEFIGLRHNLEVMDARGNPVIPGLIDAHIHLEQYALGQEKVDCETSTRGECIGKVSARASQLPPGEWLLGHGWNQNEWKEGFGTALDLDAVAPHNPVYLTAKSLHAGWANSAALAAAGITAQSPDPSGGQISRDERGIPTGILYESAMELIHSVLPEPTEEQVAQAIQQVLPK